MEPMIPETFPVSTLGRTIMVTFSTIDQALHGQALCARLQVEQRYKKLDAARPITVHELLSGDPVTICACALQDLQEDEKNVLNLVLATKAARRQHEKASGDSTNLWVDLAQAGLLLDDLGSQEVAPLMQSWYTQTLAELREIHAFTKERLQHESPWEDRLLSLIIKERVEDGGHHLRSKTIAQAERLISNICEKYEGPYLYGDERYGEMLFEGWTDNVIQDGTGGARDGLIESVLRWDGVNKVDNVGRTLLGHDALEAAHRQDLKVRLSQCDDVMLVTGWQRALLGKLGEEPLRTLAEAVGRGEVHTLPSGELLVRAPQPLVSAAVKTITQARRNVSVRNTEVKTEVRTLYCRVWGDENDLEHWVETAEVARTLWVDAGSGAVASTHWDKALVLVRAGKQQ